MRRRGDAVSESEPSVPQPTPLSEAAPEEPPPEHRPLPPGPLRLVQVTVEEQLELAVVFKRTYTFEHDRPPRLADEQLPLDEEGERHEEIAPDVTPSYRSLPEAIGFKTGTDVVVQGSARPPRPTRQMTVSAQVGGHSPRTVRVVGPRVADHVNGRIVFSDPEAFERMPLRWEHAYGGRDERFEDALMEDVEASAGEDVLRRARPSAEALLAEVHPLMYPRNRFGKGYVLDERPELVEGRELPTLEDPRDPLTPERLVLEDPLDWNGQPLPACFDYLDPGSFPRGAMLGMPPPGWDRPETVAEVERGWIPRDFCRGNVFAGSGRDVPRLLHPFASRCAAPGLWMPFLRGDEVVRLEGMDPHRPELRVQLPPERPRFTVPGVRPDPATVESRLYLVRIDVPEQRLTLVWTGRAALSDPLSPQRAKELTSDVHVDMTRI